MKRKLIALALICAMLFSLSACSVVQDVASGVLDKIGKDEAKAQATQEASGIAAPAGLSTPALTPIPTATPRPIGEEMHLEEMPVDWNGIQMQFPWGFEVTNDSNLLTGVPKTDTHAMDIAAIITGLWTRDASTTYTRTLDEEKDIRLSESGADIERTRLGGAEAEIIRSVSDDGTRRIHLELYLKEDFVLIDFAGDDAYADLYEQTLNTISVDGSLIPDVTKATDPDTLRRNGLNPLAYSACGLYINMPATYEPYLMDDGAVAFYAPDGSGFISLKEADVTDMLLSQEQYEEMLRKTEGYKSFITYMKGSINGLEALGVSWLMNSNGRDITLENVYIRHALGTTRVVTAYANGDAEMRSDAAGQTIRQANGWLGEGLLDVDPTTLPRPTVESTPTEASDRSVRGMWNGQTYENGYFGFGFTLAEDMTVQDMQQMNNLTDDQMTDDALLGLLNRHVTLYLLQAQKGDGAMTVAVMVENLVSVAAGSMTETQYAETVTNQVNKQLTGQGYVNKSEEIVPVDFLGGQHIRSSSVYELSGIRVYVTYLFVRTGDNMLSFLVTGTNAEDVSAFFDACYAVN